MRTLAALFLALSVSAVELQWDANPPEEEAWYVVRASSDPTLPLLEWPVVAVTQDTFHRINGTGQRQFFVIQASNIFGLAEFSIVTNAPARTTRPNQLRIAR